MAEDQASSPTSKEHNAVHDDAIWRQLIKYELDWARSWEQKWGFMKESYGTLEEQKGRPAVHVNSDTMASGLPAIKGSLATKDTYRFENFDQTGKAKSEVLDNDAKKEYFLLTHQVKKLQKITGLPTEKYSFPPTRNSEIGWWYTNAANRMKANNSKSMKFDKDNLNTLLDVKLGRYNALG